MRKEISSLLKVEEFDFSNGRKPWFALVIDGINYGCLRKEDFDALKEVNGPLMYKGYECDSTSDLRIIEFEILKVEAIQSVSGLPEGEAKPIPKAYKGDNK